MKETIAGIILTLLFIIGLGYFFGGTIQPDLRGNGGYEPSRVDGHPLWND